MSRFFFSMLYTKISDADARCQSYQTCLKRQSSKYLHQRAFLLYFVLNKTKTKRKTYGKLYIQWTMFLYLKLYLCGGWGGVGLREGDP